MRGRGRGRGLSGWTAAGLCLAIAALVLTAGLGCKRNGGGGGKQQPPVPVPVPAAVPVVDVHTHLFNARDLPIEGIARANGVPRGVARSLAKLVNHWTPAEDLNERAGQAEAAPAPAAAAPEAVPDKVSEVARSVRANVESRRGARPEAAGGEGAEAAGASLLEPLTEAERQELLKYAGTGGAPEAAEPAPAAVAATADERAVEAVARVLQKAKIPPEESAAAQAEAFSVANLRGYVRFLGVITRRHAGIARQVSGQYPAVDLFVHHMMDMARTYDDEPAVRFADQSKLMARLDAGTGGRTIHFVAFDPFRRGDALAYVKRGLAAGAIGVKFYPPSGYSATDNKILPRPGDAAGAAQWDSRYGGREPLDGAKLDAINDALFAFCADPANDVPIFTHCTPQGFEAAKDYGKKSSPEYWASVLKKHPNLRLCFGHAGGHDYWFAASGGESAQKAFGEQVVELCLAHRNVYCEVGYLEQVADPAARDKLAARLAEVMNRSSGDGSWKFGERIMYGSDWFMIAKEPRQASYLADFWAAFQDARLEPWRRRFFGRNAVEYLKLAQIAEGTSGPFSAGQRQYWRQLVAEANAE